jgi:hypothetical protein
MLSDLDGDYIKPVVFALILFRQRYYLRERDALSSLKRTVTSIVLELPL